MLTWERFIGQFDSLVAITILKCDHEYDQKALAYIISGMTDGLYDRIQTMFQPVYSHFYKHTAVRSKSLCA